MKRVLIVGAGIDAWMTAAALATATKGLAEVVVAETGPPPAGRIAALPSLSGCASVVDGRRTLRNFAPSSRASSRVKLSSRSEAEPRRAWLTWPM